MLLSAGVDDEVLWADADSAVAVLEEVEEEAWDWEAALDDGGEEAVADEFALLAAVEA